MMPTTHKEFKPEDLERGLKNKHYKKFERQQMILDYARYCLMKHEIKRKAGFFDKKNNIFEEHKEGVCEYCGGDIKIRNPTGKCDHLYYPENVNQNYPEQSEGQRKDKTDCR